MPQQDDLDPLVGKLALQRGLINQPQLLEALRECGVSETRLADVLLSKGFVRKDDVTSITRDLGPLLAQAGDWEHTRAEDIKLAKALISRKALDEPTARTALSTQAAEYKADPATVPRLAVILLRDNLLEFETLKPFLHAGLTIELVCPQCSVGYMIPESGAEKKWHCRRCRGVLARKQGGSVQVKDDSVPEEVRAAMADDKRRFGKFWLVRELGRGGMGAVYKAWEPALRRFVAIKVLLGKSGADDVARFYREAQTAAKLRHPNIIQIYEVSKVAERHYISMEYVDGNPLGAERLPARRAAELLREAALAVDHAHKEGVVHRDIKSSNLMLDSKGKVFVMDFGLAKSLAAESRLTAAGTIVGTPSYMSPEQAQGKLVDKVSDTYSLGAVLFELLTGRPPFRANNPIETLNQVLTKEPPPLAELAPGTPRDLDAIVMKALEKQRARRYPSARALADDLQRWLNGAQVQAKARTAADRLMRSLSRKLPLLLGVAGAVLVAVIVVFMVVSSRTRGEAEQSVRAGDEALAKGDLQKALVEYGAARKAAPGLPGLAAKIKEVEGLLDDEKRRADDAKRKAEDEARRVREANEKRAAAALDLNAGEQKLIEAERDLFRTGADLSKMADAVRAAMTRINQAIEKSPNYAEAYAARGRAWGMLFESAKAEADFGEAIKHNPKLGEAWRERGRLRLERYMSAVASGTQEIEFTEQVLKPLGKAAAADLQRAGELEGEADREYLEAGIAFAEQRPQDVENSLTKAIGAGRGKEHHFYLRGHVRYTMAQLMPPGEKRRKTAEASLADLDEALRQRPNYSNALYMRAALKFDFFDRIAARQDFLATVRVNPRDAQGWHGLGLYYQKMGDGDRAIEAFGRGIEADPRSVKCLTSRGMQKHVKGDLAGARTDYEAALNVDPRYFDARLNFAALLTKVSGDAAALEELNRMIADFPQKAAVYHMRGRVYARMGKLRECVSDLERAIQMGDRDPENQAIINEAKKHIK